jgi:hypothetical protein
MTPPLWEQAANLAGTIEEHVNQAVPIFRLLSQHQIASWNGRFLQ